MKSSRDSLLSATAWWLSTHAPRFLNLVKRWYGNYIAVPANMVMGIRIAEVSSDSSRVVVRLKNMRNNRNAAGTVHGAALFALAEAVHGTAVMWQFSPLQHRMFTKTANLEFLMPGRGELVVDYSLSCELLHRIGGELAEQGRSEISAESCVRNLGGEIVAKLSATYVILRRTR